MCPWTVLERKLNTILRKLNQILTKETAMSVELDNLAVQVKANTDAEESAVLLLGKLHDLIVAAGTDPVKLQALAADLASSKEALAAAILANTPAAP